MSNRKNATLWLGMDVGTGVHGAGMAFLVKTPQEEVVLARNGNESTRGQSAQTPYTASHTLNLEK